LGIQGEVFYARVSSVRTVDIKCADKDMTLIQTGPRTFKCKKTIQSKGERVDLVAQVPNCKQPGSKLFGEDTCFKADACPRSRIPPLVGDLTCAPITARGLDLLFRDLAREYDKGFDPVSTASDEYLKTCLFYCHTAFARRAECDELEGLVTIQGRDFEWGGEGAFMKSFENDPVNLEKLIEMQSRISACFADPKVTNPKTLGRTISDETGTQLSFQGVNKVMEAMYDHPNDDRNPWQEYVQFHIPLAMAKSVKSRLSDVILKADPQLLMDIANTHSFADVTQTSYTTHHERIAAQNCRYYAEMSFKRTERMTGSAAVDACCDSCRDHHDSRRRA
jgi:hypothetical protein